VTAHDTFDMQLHLPRYITHLPPVTAHRVPPCLLAGSLLGWTEFRANLPMFLSKGTDGKK
jgi:hypothetical protein